MSQRFIVRASLLPGYNHYFRAGRGWTASATEIELVDQDDDPMLPNPKPGLPEVAHPTQVGRKSFTILEKDPRISIKTVGEESSEAMAAQLPGVQLELSRAAARIAELEAAREQDESHISTLEAGRAALQAQIAELKSELKLVQGAKDSQAKELAELKATLDGPTDPEPKPEKKPKAPKT